MPYCPSLEEMLDADIDDSLPTSNVGGSDPISWVLALPGTSAPIVSISRNPTSGVVCVPTLFLAIAEVQLLPHLIKVCLESVEGGGFLVHACEVRRCGKILLAPFLYDRNPSSREFIQKAFEIGHGVVSSQVTAAFLIQDCHVCIGTAGQLHEPRNFPTAFDHRREKLF
jgi:hypothetical protein